MHRPEELRRNPSLLLHRSSEWNDDDIKPHDGLTAALVSKGELIVTSPNSKTIPYPPLGGDRTVYLRDNLRYADDDPLLWPQPFIENLPHLSLIRLPPKSEDDPLHIMWWQPDIKEFILERSVLTGIGKLDPSLVSHLRLACLSAVEQARQYRSSALFQEYATTVMILLDRLSSLAMSFERARLCVREAQRAFLELVALIDWPDTFQPRVTGKVAHTGKIARVMGCFTYNIGICEDYYRAGIPVYLIRDFTELHTMRIKQVVTPVMPDEIITSTYKVKYTTIYVGAATSPDKYRAMRRFSHLFHAYANPFNKHRVPLRHEPIPEPTSSGLDRQARALRYSPYAQRTKKRSQFYGTQGRDKFEDPIDPIFPPAIPAWREALHLVDRSKSNFVDPDNRLGSDSGYAFPEPASFIAFEKKERRHVALCSWVQYRNAMIYRLISEQSDARPMSGKAWRDMLSLDWLQHPNGHSSVNIETQETSSRKKINNSRRMEWLTDFLGTCLQMDGLTLDEAARGDESWNGKPFATLEDKDSEEILWELAELNFRQEFLALELRIHHSDPDLVRRQERISGCFPGRQLLSVPLSEANHGIASYDQEERCRYLLEMQRVVRDWPGAKAEILEVDKLRWCSRDIEDLEVAVARCYTQTFYNFFHRAPIVPRRLSHTISGFTLPPPPLQHLNPAPQTYYDMTQLEYASVKE